MTILGAFTAFSLLGGGFGVMQAVPVAPVLPNYTVTLTAYNAVPAQTDNDPFVTASGAYSNPEIVAARSRDLADELPFGTIIAITGPDADPKNTCGFDVVKSVIGYRVIEDTMNAKFTKRIDVLVPTNANVQLGGGKTMNAANVLGICDGVTIRVVGHVDFNRLPKTQSALAALVMGSGGLALK